MQTRQMSVMGTLALSQITIVTLASKSNTAVASVMSRQLHNYCAVLELHTQERWVECFAAGIPI